MVRVALGLLAALIAAGTVAAGVRLLRPRAPAAAPDLRALMPSIGLYTEADVGREFVWVRIVPFGKRGRAFQLLLPRDWEWREAQVRPGQLQEDDREPVPLAEMGPMSDEDALLEVRYVRVPDHVSLERFVKVYAERSGHEVVAEQAGAFGPSRRQVHDALLRKVSPQFGPTLTRLSVSRRGGLIFLVAGSAPAATFARWKRIFGVAAVSFEPSAG
jgi:hypothetical protein